MKSGKLNKMATILAVLFLVMSGLMVVQWNAQPVEATQHEEDTYRIEGFIDPGNDVIIQSDLDIKLRSLSTGETWTEQTSETFYEFTNVKPGWYEIIFPSQVEDDIAYMRNTTEALEVSDEDIIGENFNVKTRQIIDHSMEVNVTYDGEAIENPEQVTVTLRDKGLGFMQEASLIDEENATFSADIYDEFSGNGSLMVEKEGYSPYFNTSVTLDLNNETTFEEVELSTTPLVEGRLIDEEGRGIKEEMEITLYNETVGVLHRTKVGPTFRIRGPVGYDYTLVVDAQGYTPLVVDSISFSSEGDIIKLDTTKVEKSESEEFKTDIDFKYDEQTELDNLTVNTTRSIRTSTRMKTLDHSFVGNLAMQIDLALGDGDEYVDSTEVDEFKQRLNYTKKIAYTPEFITVNETVFELKNYTVEFSDNFTEKLVGEVNASNLFDGEIYFNTTRTYRTYKPADIGPGRHIINLKVDHDRMYGNRRNYTYTVDLRDGYERYVGENSEEVIPDDVEVDGYTNPHINPMENGLTSELTFDVRQSEKGEVDLAIVNEPWIHELEDDQGYVIKKGTEAEIIADHQNPTSIALEYNWSLNGETIPDVEGEEITHAFSDGDSGTLKVEVNQSSGKTVDDSVNITVDDQGPVGNILVNKEEYSHGETVEVNETEEIEFSGSNFNDTATGIVDQYEWTFNSSDGEETKEEGMNVTYTFEVPGEYNVTLNVTDGVGNANELSINVTAKDITKPTVVIRTEWNGGNSYEPEVSDGDLLIGTNVTFNATESVAHEEYEGELENITWWIEELEMKEKGDFSENQILENISFEEEGDYTVWANVTDVSGNYRNESVTVNIGRGPTPDLVVSNLRFSKDEIRAGDTVTISVNVTNVGDANTTEITTVLRVDGEEIKRFEPDLIKNGEELERNHIEPNEEVRIDIEWEPETDGEMTVNVNVTDEGERDHTDILWDNDEEQSVSIDPAAWREYIVYALIPIIIIGVTVGLYLFKDRLREMMR